MMKISKKISVIFFTALVFSGLFVPTKTTRAIDVACQELKLNLNLSPNEVPVNDKVTRAETKEAKKKLKKQCIKEYFLDNIAWVAANTVIQSMTSSIVNWVNNGFEGSPAFVQDLKGHFQELGNAVFEDMLKVFDVEDFVCSSFSARLKKSFEISLAIGKSGSGAGEKAFFKSARCTVDDVLKNANSTISEFKDDFSKGGWDAWASLVQPENNELGATLIFHDELWRRQGNEKAREDKELSFGQGFMSWKKEGACIRSVDNDEGYDPDGDHSADSADSSGCYEREPSQIMTPGKVIQDQLDQSLGGGQRRIEIADEIDEIIGAVMNQLVNKVLSGGLAGASSGSNGNRSVTDQLRDERTSTSATRSGLQNSIDNDLADLDEYIAVKQNSLGILDRSIALLQSLLQCYQENGNTSGIQTTQSQINTLQQQKSVLEQTIADARADRTTLESFRAQSEITQDDAENSILRDTTTAYANLGTKYDLEDAQSENIQMASDAAQRDSSTQEKLSICGFRGGLPFPPFSP